MLFIQVMTPRRILVVGSPTDSRALAELLVLEGHMAEVALHANAKRAVQLYRPEIVIADVAHPKLDGLSLLRSLSALQPGPRTIMISSRPTSALEPLGVTCLSKPLDLPQLWQTLDLRWQPVPLAAGV